MPIRPIQWSRNSRINSLILDLKIYLLVEVNTKKQETRNILPVNIKHSQGKHANFPFDFGLGLAAKTNNESSKGFRVRR
jgi:hypothetical protein